MCSAHSHTPAPQFHPSCQNASDTGGPKAGGAEAGDPPREPNQYLDSFRRQEIALAFTLGSKLCIRLLPKLLFVQFQALALERFLPEGNNKHRVLEKKLSSFGSESEESCKPG